MRKLALMFRTRHPGRDRAGDAARRQRLEATVDQVAQDVARERQGLGLRLTEVQDALAFLYEDGDASGKPERVASMEEELKRAMERTRLLDQQLAGLATIRRAIDDCFPLPEAGDAGS